MRSAQFTYLREMIRQATQLERDWLGRVAETDRRYTPWMPFSLPQYVALLAEALPEAPGDRFLEIGSGPGSKMLIARELFGLEVHGIEFNPEYAREAVSLGLHVMTGDAADFGDYHRYDLIWFHRPFRDPDSQAALEKRVWDDMAPGAVVITANLEGPPPPDRFHIILDDQEIRRGIYMKAMLP